MLTYYPTRSVTRSKWVGRIRLPFIQYLIDIFHNRRNHFFISIKIFILNIPDNS